MADEKTFKPKAPVAQPKNDAAQAAKDAHCKFESCKKSNEKFGFCMEHYDLYMAGVIRGDGRKPLDFESKMARHLADQQKSRKVA